MKKDAGMRETPVTQEASVIRETPARQETPGMPDALVICESPVMLDTPVVQEPDVTPGPPVKQDAPVIREAAHQDLEALLELYRWLNSDPIPPARDAKALWERLLAAEEIHVLAAEEKGRLVSSCTLAVIPNLTHGGKPYALVENVVTHPDWRGRGLASACLDHARELARREGCYKIMLLTGSKQDSTLRFYERAGYNRSDKTAFLQWL